MLCREITDDGTQAALGKIDRRRDAQQAAWCRLHIVDDFFCGGDVGDHGADTVVIHLPNIGEGKFPGGALDQAHPEPFFELRKFTAHRRFGHAEHERRGREALGLNDFAKHQDFVEIHHRMSSNPEMSLRAIRATHYRQLTEKVDEFFARVASREAAAMQCATGCSDCCQYGLSATVAEAEAVADVVAAMTADERLALAHNIDRRRADVAAGAAQPRCVALNEAGRCMIYAGRPTVCRSHGVPVRLLDERSLPVVSACYRNFVERAPDTIAADCVLDQTTLSATLLAINAGATERFALEDLLVDLLEQA